jgi:hypothetical protein
MAWSHLVTHINSRTTTWAQVLSEKDYRRGESDVKNYQCEALFRVMNERRGWAGVPAARTRERPRGAEADLKYGIDLLDVYRGRVGYPGARYR